MVMPPASVSHRLQCVLAAMARRVFAKYPGRPYNIERNTKRRPDRCRSTAPPIHTPNEQNVFRMMIRMLIVQPPSANAPTGQRHHHHLQAGVDVFISTTEQHRKSDAFAGTPASCRRRRRPVVVVEQTRENQPGVRHDIGDAASEKRQTLAVDWSAGLLLLRSERDPRRSLTSPSRLVESPVKSY